MRSSRHGKFHLFSFSVLAVSGCSEKCIHYFSHFEPSSFLRKYTHQELLQCAAKEPRRFLLDNAFSYFSNVDKNLTPILYQIIMFFSVKIRESSSINYKITYKVIQGRISASSTKQVIFLQVIQKQLTI